MTEWPLVKLGDLGEVNRGRSRHRPRYAEHLYGGPYPFIQTGDIRESGGRITSHKQTYSEAGLAQSRLWPAGTMCITIAANIAETAILTYPACFPDSVVGFIADPKKCSVHFIEYMFRYLRSKIQHEATGSVQDNINLATLDRLKFPLPPLREQQAIACILGALDDKIELNRRRNKTLEAMARAIFQSWFVDFDPVQAKAAGRTPPGLSPALAAHFPDRFEDSPLGPTPAGWRVGTVGDLAEINGWTLGKRDALAEIDYIEISEVMRGEVATMTRYARGSEPSRARRRLRHGDTALSTVRPDRGAYFLSIEPSPNLIASTGFAILTAQDGNWAFVHVLTTRREFGDELGRLADGGAYPAVRPEVIAARPAIIPSDQVVAAFEKIAEPMFLSAEKARQESRTLAALRDALLPKLISGELRVPDAERIVGRAV